MPWFSTSWLRDPRSIIICLLARPGLAFWIADFADASYRVVQILAVAMLINSVGFISQAVVQARGRADLTAKLQLFEIVAYVPYLWMLVSRLGTSRSRYRLGLCGWP